MFACSFWTRAWFSPDSEEFTLMALCGGPTAATGDYGFDIAATAARLRPAVQLRVGDGFTVEVVSCHSEIGSGALPRRTLPSTGLAIRRTAKRGAGHALDDLAAALRRRPMPVVGRIESGTVILDPRPTFLTTSPL